MPTVNQLVKNIRTPKKRKVKKLALKINFNSKKKKYYFANNPFKKGNIKKVGVSKPKKPNSANRPYARVVLSNRREVTIYIPGERHNLQEYSSVLTSGRGAKDLPGVKYRVVRGYSRGDAKGVEKRSQGRSLYGTKKSSK
jgi:small subunit ribosomal protein S12